MMAAMFAAAAIDTAVKALSGGYPVSEIVLVRCAFALPLTLLIASHQGGIQQALVTTRPGWHLYRSCISCGATFGFFYGLAYLPLLTAVLLAYISPLLIVLLSHFLLHERVGWRRVAGVFIGFLGTLLIVRPDGFTLHPAVLAVFASSLCWALLAISNRQLAGKESPASLAIYTLPVSFVLAGFFTVGEWVTPQGGDWLLFAVAGFGAASIHFLTANASRHARAATLAPLEYTNLVWVALAAYLFWSEVPSGWTLAGGAAIVAGGFVAVRARQ